MVKLVKNESESTNLYLTTIASNLSSTIDGPKGSVIGSACTTNSGLIDQVYMKSQFRDISYRNRKQITKTILKPIGKKAFILGQSTCSLTMYSYSYDSIVQPKSRKMKINNQSWNGKTSVIVAQSKCYKTNFYPSEIDKDANCLEIISLPRSRYKTTRLIRQTQC